MRAALIAVMVLVSACAGEAAEEPTTSSAVPVEPPATSTPSMTSNVALEAVDVCGGRAEIWEAGRTYVAGCFFNPIWFEPQDVGWRSVGVREFVLLLTWIEDGRKEGVRLAVFAYEPFAPAAEVLDQIVNIDGIEPLGDRA